MSEEIVSSGGLCAPVSPSYELPYNNTRPIRDAMNEWFRRNIERGKLPEDERIAFDIVHYGYAVSGNEDVAARVCEVRYDEDDWDEDGDGYGYGYDHEWDKPITIRSWFAYLR